MDVLFFDTCTPNFRNEVRYPGPRTHKITPMLTMEWIRITIAPASEPLDGMTECSC